MCIFRAEEVILLDSKTIFLKYFTYDGRGGDGVHFWVGNGPQPDRKGHIVPNERGYLEPLGRYDSLNGKSVRLQLPGNLTVFDINWFSVFDTKVSRYVENTWNVVSHSTFLQYSSFYSVVKKTPGLTTYIQH